MSPTPVIEGAFTTVMLYALPFCIGWWLGNVIFTLYRKARLWDRYTRACGGDESAMRVLAAAEALDTQMRRGFKAAKRYGWLPEGWL